MKTDTLKSLDNLIKQRLSVQENNSYVAKMNSLGIDKMLQKISEEASEVLIASKNNDTENLVYELADLWFHSLLVAHHHKLSSQNILEELQRRMGQSGIEEKELRAKK